MTLPTDRYLDELEKAKIIEENSGNYGFCTSNISIISWPDLYVPTLTGKTATNFGAQ